MIIRSMADGEEDAVADMVHGLAQDLNLNPKPIITGLKLRASRDLVDITVAEENGALLGACLTLMTYSTFRAAKGMYVVDLFVNGKARNHNVGLKLLKASALAAMARGATFIKLEVDAGNEGGARFYGRIGFKKKEEDRLLILEQDGLAKFAKDIT
jgi:ribosomal protein S18 acetylase RimI-like enzyme